jgi:pimeloyl-ACP methyl ester carboxylesterase
VALEEPNVMLNNKLLSLLALTVTALGCGAVTSGQAAPTAPTAHEATTPSSPLPPPTLSYVETPNRFVEAAGRRIAYRRTGSGPPMILCNRFRGIMDSWDPAFVDALAQHFDVITFDYSGLGLSSGPAPTDITSMAKDVDDLAAGLGLDSAVMVGWSLGGLVAQTVLSRFPQRVHHLVLIGTLPPGKNDYSAEPVFLERAHKPVNDLDDEVVLFFEPDSPASTRAAKLSHDRIAQRQRDLSVPVPPELWPGLHQAGKQFLKDDAGVRQQLMQTSTPILIISGDHDVSCPIENWYALSRKLPTAQLVVFPRTGHGPQHEHVAASVTLITTFVASTH